MLKKILALTLAPILFALAQPAHAGLDEVKKRGVLTVAVYRDFAPFADDGKGIDIEIAQALAEKLGVRASVQSYDAAENMDDDLRNMVWKGSLFGVGPAASDLMMHVPTETAFAERNPKVKIFGAYYRETLAVVRNTQQLDKLDTYLPIEGKPVGVEGDSITDMALMHHDGGRYMRNIKHYMKLDLAAADLKAGTITAFFGTRSQVEPMTKAAGSGFAMSVPPPLPGVAQAGWTHGLAVKADDGGLADALARALAALEQDGTLDRIFARHGVTRLKPL